MRGTDNLGNGISQTEGETITARAAGHLWSLHRDANLEQLWDALDDNEFDEDHIPYWTELWPASIALADFLAARKREIAGRLCAEMGCGLGLAAIVGSWLGAGVAAIDLDAEALRHCRINAAANHVCQPAWICMDWRRPAFRPGIFWRVWGADIVYEKRFIEPVLNFLGLALAENGAAWIAEPGRGFFSAFLNAADSLGWSYAPVLAKKVEGMPPQTLINVTVWEFRKR